MVSSGGYFGRSVLTLSPRLFPCLHAPFVRLCSKVRQGTSASYCPESVAFPVRCRAKVEWKFIRSTANRRSKCDSMRGFKHVLYIFIFAVMHILWATSVNIPPNAVPNPAKFNPPIRILWDRTTADALAPQNAKSCNCNIIHNED